MRNTYNKTLISSAVAKLAHVRSIPDHVMAEGVLDNFLADESNEVALVIGYAWSDISNDIFECIDAAVTELNSRLA